LQLLFSQANIEHIGSTAVPNLGGKGILDIILSVPKKTMKNAKRALIQTYTYDASGGSDERDFFLREIVYRKKKRFIHLHLTFHNSKEWHQALWFRNSLRNNPRIRNDYIKLKKKACNYAKGDGKKYRQYKNTFIKKILNLQ